MTPTNETSPTITITPTELEALLSRVRQRQLSDQDWLLIDKLILVVIKLWAMLQKKKPSLKQIKLWLFGPEQKAANESDEAQSVAAEQAPEPKPRKKARGHGRMASSAYKNAKKVRCEHTELQPGSACPDKLCRGHLQQFYRDSPFIRLVGQPLISAILYEQEILRCSDCELTFTAPLPPNVPYEKYDATADAAMILAKYRYGVPWNRLSQWQSSFGVPLPSSVQFDRAEAVANILFPIFLNLQLLAAMAVVIYQDDTKIRILQCQPSKADKRKGVRTTGIIADCQDYQIALYASGRNHAGDNVDELLAKRPKEMSLVIKMSDALKLNLSGLCAAIIALCLAHGRRKFTDIQKLFPDECKHVIDEIGKVYDNEEQTKKMSPTQRLQYHQEHSGPIMKKLKIWIEEQFSQKNVEPNDPLGGAYNYLLNNWQGLTQFLRTENCPLDNNPVERALKLIVLNRKNSLFFRNDTGAFISDVLTSVIQTCRINSIEPYDYLVSVINNATKVKNNPEQWLPWRYAKDSSEQMAQSNSANLSPIFGKIGVHGVALGQ
jgi:transposase